MVRGEEIDKMAHFYVNLLLGIASVLVKIMFFQIIFLPIMQKDCTSKILTKSLHKKKKKIVPFQAKENQLKGNHAL